MRYVSVSRFFCQTFLCPFKFLNNFKRFLRIFRPEKVQFHTLTLLLFSFSFFFHLLVSKNTVIFRRRGGRESDSCFYASFIRSPFVHTASARAKAERRNKWSGNYSLCESRWVVVGSETEIRYDFISASRPRYAPRASFISFVQVEE